MNRNSPTNISKSSKKKSTISPLPRKTSSFTQNTRPTVSTSKRYNSTIAQGVDLGGEKKGKTHTNQNRTNLTKSSTDGTLHGSHNTNTNTQDEPNQQHTLDSNINPSNHKDAQKLTINAPKFRKMQTQKLFKNSIKIPTLTIPSLFHSHTAYNSAFVAISMRQFARTHSFRATHIAHAIARDAAGDKPTLNPPKLETIVDKLQKSPTSFFDGLKLDPETPESLHKFIAVLQAIPAPKPAPSTNDNTIDGGDNNNNNNEGDDNRPRLRTRKRTEEELLFDSFISQPTNIIKEVDLAFINSHSLSPEEKLRLMRLEYNEVSLNPHKIAQHFNLQLDALTISSRDALHDQLLELMYAKGKIMRPMKGQPGFLSRLNHIEPLHPLPVTSEATIQTTTKSNHGDLFPLTKLENVGEEFAIKIANSPGYSVLSLRHLSDHEKKLQKEKAQEFPYENPQTPTKITQSISQRAKVIHSMEFDHANQQYYTGTIPLHVMTDEVMKDTHRLLQESHDHLHGSNPTHNGIDPFAVQPPLTQQEFQGGLLSVTTLARTQQAVISQLLSHFSQTLQDYAQTGKFPRHSEFFLPIYEPGGVPAHLLASHDANVKNILTPYPPRKQKQILHILGLLSSYLSPQTVRTLFANQFIPNRLDGLTEFVLKYPNMANYSKLRRAYNQVLRKSDTMIPPRTHAAVLIGNSVCRDDFGANAIAKQHEDSVILALEKMGKSGEYSDKQIAQLAKLSIDAKNQKDQSDGTEHRQLLVPIQSYINPPQYLSSHPKHAMIFGQGSSNTNYGKTSQNPIKMAGSVDVTTIPHIGLDYALPSQFFSLESLCFDCIGNDKLQHLFKLHNSKKLYPSGTKRERITQNHLQLLPPSLQHFVYLLTSPLQFGNVNTKVFKIDTSQHPDFDPNIAPESLANYPTTFVNTNTDETITPNMYLGVYVKSTKSHVGANNVAEVQSENHLLNINLHRCLTDPEYALISFAHLFADVYDPKSNNFKHKLATLDDIAILPLFNPSGVNQLAQLKNHFQNLAEVQAEQGVLPGGVVSSDPTTFLSAMSVSMDQFGVPIGSTQDDVINHGAILVGLKYRWLQATWEAMRYELVSERFKKAQELNITDLGNVASSNRAQRVSTLQQQPKDRKKLRILRQGDELLDRIRAPKDYGLELSDNEWKALVQSDDERTKYGNAPSEDEEAFNRRIGKGTNSQTGEYTAQDILDVDTEILFDGQKRLKIKKQQERDDGKEHGTLTPAQRRRRDLGLERDDQIGYDEEMDAEERINHLNSLGDGNKRRKGSNIDPDDNGDPYAEKSQSKFSNMDDDDQAGGDEAGDFAAARRRRREMLLEEDEQSSGDEFGSLKRKKEKITADDVADMLDPDVHRDIELSDVVEMINEYKAVKTKEINEDPLLLKYRQSLYNPIVLLPSPTIYSVDFVRNLLDLGIHHEMWLLSNDSIPEANEVISNSLSKLGWSEMSLSHIAATPHNNYTVMNAHLDHFVSFNAIRPSYKIKLNPSLSALSEAQNAIQLRVQNGEKIDPEVALAKTKIKIVDPYISDVRSKMDNLAALGIEPETLQETRINSKGERVLESTPSDIFTTGLTDLDTDFASSAVNILTSQFILNIRSIIELLGDMDENALDDAVLSIQAPRIAQFKKHYPAEFQRDYHSVEHVLKNLAQYQPGIDSKPTPAHLSKLLTMVLMRPHALEKLNLFVKPTVSFPTQYQFESFFTSVNTAQERYGLRIPTLSAYDSHILEKIQESIVETIQAAGSMTTVQAIAKLRTTLREVMLKRLQQKMDIFFQAMAHHQGKLQAVGMISSIFQDNFANGNIDVSKRSNNRFSGGNSSNSFLAMFSRLNKQGANSTNMSTSGQINPSASQQPSVSPFQFMTTSDDVNVLLDYYFRKSRYGQSYITAAIKPQLGYDQLTENSKMQQQLLSHNVVSSKQASLQEQENSKLSFGPDDSGTEFTDDEADQPKKNYAQKIKSLQTSIETSLLDPSVMSTRLEQEQPLFRRLQPGFMAPIHPQVHSLDHVLPLLNQATEFLPFGVNEHTRPQAISQLKTMNSINSYFPSTTASLLSIEHHINNRNYSTALDLLVQTLLRYNSTKLSKAKEVKDSDREWRFAYGKLPTEDHFPYPQLFTYGFMLCQALGDWSTAIWLIQFVKQYHHYPSLSQLSLLAQSVHTSLAPPQQSKILQKRLKGIKSGQNMAKSGIFDQDSQVEAENMVTHTKTIHHLRQEVGKKLWLTTKYAVVHHKNMTLDVPFVLSILQLYHNLDDAVQLFYEALAWPVNVNTKFFLKFQQHLTRIQDEYKIIHLTSAAATAGTSSIVLSTQEQDQINKIDDKFSQISNFVSFLMSKIFVKQFKLYQKLTLDNINLLDKLQQIQLDHKLSHAQELGDVKMALSIVENLHQQQALQTPAHAKLRGLSATHWGYVLGTIANRWKLVNVAQDNLQLTSATSPTRFVLTSEQQQDLLLAQRIFLHCLFENKLEDHYLWINLLKIYNIFFDSATVLSVTQFLFLLNGMSTSMSFLPFNLNNQYDMLQWNEDSFGHYPTTWENLTENQKQSAQSRLNRAARLSARENQVADHNTMDVVNRGFIDLETDEKSVDADQFNLTLLASYKPRVKTINHKNMWNALDLQWSVQDLLGDYTVKKQNKVYGDGHKQNSFDSILQNNPLDQINPTPTLTPTQILSGGAQKAQNQGQVTSPEALAASTKLINSLFSYILPWSLNDRLRLQSSFDSLQSYMTFYYSRLKVQSISTPIIHEAYTKNVKHGPHTLKLTDFSQILNTNQEDIYKSGKPSENIQMSSDVPIKVLPYPEHIHDQYHVEDFANQFPKLGQILPTFDKIYPHHPLTAENQSQQRFKYQQQTPHHHAKLPQMQDKVNSADLTHGLLNQHPLFSLFSPLQSHMAHSSAPLPTADVLNIALPHLARTSPLHGFMGLLWVVNSTHRNLNHSSRKLKELEFNTMTKPGQQQQHVSNAMVEAMGPLAFIESIQRPFVAKRITGHNVDASVNPLINTKSREERLIDDSDDDFYEQINRDSDAEVDLLHENDVFRDHLGSSVIETSHVISLPQNEAALASPETQHIMNHLPLSLKDSMSQQEQLRYMQLAKINNEVLVNGYSDNDIAAVILSTSRALFALGYYGLAIQAYNLLPPQSMTTELAISAQKDGKDGKDGRDEEQTTLKSGTTQLRPFTARYHSHNLPQFSTIQLNNQNESTQVVSLDVTNMDPIHSNLYIRSQLQPLIMQVVDQMIHHQRAFYLSKIGKKAKQNPSNNEMTQYPNQNNNDQNIEAQTEITDDVHTIWKVVQDQTPVSSYNPYSVPALMIVAGDFANPDRTLQESLIFHFDKEFNPTLKDRKGFTDNRQFDENIDPEYELNDKDILNDQGKAPSHEALLEHDLKPTKPPVPIVVDMLYHDNTTSTSYNQYLLYGGGSYQTDGAGLPAAGRAGSFEDIYGYLLDTNNTGRLIITPYTITAIAYRIFSQLTATTGLLDELEDINAELDRLNGASTQKLGHSNKDHGQEHLRRLGEIDIANILQRQFYGMLGSNQGDSHGKDDVKESTSIAQATQPSRYCWWQKSNPNDYDDVQSQIGKDKSLSKLSKQEQQNQSIEQNVHTHAPYLLQRPLYLFEQSATPIMKQHELDSNTQVIDYKWTPPDVAKWMVNSYHFEQQKLKNEKARIEQEQMRRQAVVQHQQQKKYVNGREVQRGKDELNNKHQKEVDNATQTALEKLQSSSTMVLPKQHGITTQGNKSDSVAKSNHTNNFKNQFKKTAKDFEAAPSAPSAPPPGSHQATNTNTPPGAPPAAAPPPRQGAVGFAQYSNYYNTKSAFSHRPEVPKQKNNQM